MRRITDHRIEEGGFNEAIQGFIRGAPWWMTSAVIHGIILFILAQVPFSIKRSHDQANLQADLQKEMDDIDEEEIEEPEPEVPEEEIIEEPIEVEEADHDETDVDQDFEETAFDDGLSDAPFTGPSDNTAIG
ncbi:MAG: hypothetical protein ACYTGV_12040, partial [Planctomycetota bacterium]